MSAIEPLVVILAFILLSKFLLTPYEASVEEKLKAVWRTKDKRACTIAFIWMTSGVSQMESKVIANWPSSCEGLQKLLLSSFSFHLQFYWLTKALISERKVKGLAFSQYMMLFFREREQISRGLVDMVLFPFDYLEQRPCFKISIDPQKRSSCFNLTAKDFDHRRKS